VIADSHTPPHFELRDVTFGEGGLVELKELAEGSGAWSIPWPCVHEFVAVVTNPRIWKVPTPLEQGTRREGA
jgi:hypothetical protein